MSKKLSSNNGSEVDEDNDDEPVASVILQQAPVDSNSLEEKRLVMTKNFCLRPRIIVLLSMKRMKVPTNMARMKILVNMEWMKVLVNMESSSLKKNSYMSLKRISSLLTKTILNYILTIVDISI